MSETFYRSMRMVCEEDNIIRTVNVKCYCFDGSFAADTVFSVPAHTYVRGCYVSGYVTQVSDADRDGRLMFCAHDKHKSRFWLKYGKLTDENRDAMRALIGRRIEIPVHYDLWMRGARFGKVTAYRGPRLDREAHLLVAMDHPQVKRSLRLWAQDVEYAKVNP